MSMKSASSNGIAKRYSDKTSANHLNEVADMQANELELLYSLSTVIEKNEYTATVDNIHTRRDEFASCFCEGFEITKKYRDNLWQKRSE